MNKTKSLNTNYFRNCPKCNETIFYCNKYTLQNAINNKCLCKICTANIQLEKIREEVKLGLRKQPFKGKTHSKETKSKIINHPNFKPWSKHDNCKGITHHFYGKPFKQRTLENWTKKYGKEKAEKMYNTMLKKKSENSSGSNNGMYGKPSPQGAGNGWSGWYNNWYFRSIHELSYMILVIERFNINWTNAEGIKIKYTNYNNDERNYFPDFLLNNKYVIEIKPKKLINSINVKAKTKAAIEYCNKNNLIFKILSPQIISIDKIKELYLNNKIKFIKKYDDKFKEKYLP